ncbi:hypothetical protein, partial [Mailhella sp.]|uniref:hypothetical protein n=1 Tax=Mailhella sp. TaxID=1981029 RepID=UPI0040640B6D
MLTKGAIGNLVNRYKAVLAKCNLINTFGSLAVASALMFAIPSVSVANENPASFDVNEVHTITVLKAPEQNANPQGWVYLDKKVSLGAGSDLTITGPTNQWGFVKNTSFDGKEA